MCEIACRDSLRFSQPVPPFYTCGAEGFWRPTANPSLPLVYPACSRKILFIAFSFIRIYLSIVHQNFNDYFVLQRLHQLNESSKFLCYSRALFFATTPVRLCFVRRFAALSTNWTETGTSVLMLSMVIFILLIVCAILFFGFYNLLMFFNHLKVLANAKNWISTWNVTTVLMYDRQDKCLHRRQLPLMTRMCWMPSFLWKSEYIWN